MGGPRYTPQQLRRAAKVLGETDNMSAAARAIGAPESSVRAALKRQRLARNRDLHAQACEAGLRAGRKALRNLGAEIEAFLADRLEAGSLEPRDLAALAKARADLAATVAKIADREDRRRSAKLERAKLRAQLRGELVEHHAVTHAGDPLDALARAVARLAPAAPVDGGPGEPDPDPAG